MAHLTPREIKAEIDRLSKRLRVAENAITVTNGVPTVQGTESDGQLAYDQLGHNLYVFDRGSYVIAVESIFFMYATAVDFTGETTADTMAGRVTSQGDVTGFTAVSLYSSWCSTLIQRNILRYRSFNESY